MCLQIHRMRLPAARQTRRHTQAHAPTHNTVYIALSDKEIFFAYTKEALCLPGGRHSWPEIHYVDWTNYKTHDNFLSHDKNHTGLPYMGTARHDQR